MTLLPLLLALLAPLRVDSDVQRILDASTTPATERRTLAAAAADALSADDVLALLDAIEDPDAIVRERIARLLARGDLGARGRRERIARLGGAAAGDAEPAVRAAALESLGAIGGPAASDVLARLVEFGPTRSDRRAAAEALARAPGGRPALLRAVRAALGGARPASATDGRAVAALLPSYGRALVDLERTTDDALAPLVLALRHSDGALRAAAADAVSEALRRLAEVEDRGRAAELLARLERLGLDPSLALYQSARLSLVTDHDPARALEFADRLAALRGMRLRPSARIDAYESQLWLYRGLALRGAARFAMGEFPSAEEAFDRAAAALDAALAERRDLASTSERLAHADLLSQRATLEVFRTLVASASGYEPRRVLLRAREVHRAHLEAQAVAASVRGDALAGFDNLLFSDLAPHALVLSGRGFAERGGLGRRRLVDFAADLGRALAAVAPGELPGFTPLEPPGLDAALRGSLVDPLIDPVRARAYDALRRARVDGLDVVIEEAQALLTLMTRRSIGLIPEEQYRAVEDLRRHRFVLQRMLDDAAPDDRTWVRDLRIPSSAALILAEDLVAEGRPDEALRIARELKRDVEERGISSWWYTLGHDRVIRAQLLVGSALTDAGRGDEAETVVLEAAERIEDLERELVDRGASTAQLETVRQLLATALVSLAVNANVRLGDPAKAEQYYERAYALRRDEFMRALLACYRARAGRGDEARALLRTIRPGPGTWYNLACTHALLGETDRALELLAEELRKNHATEESRARQAEWAAGDPDLASLRGDARFERLVGRD
ncbi:MAG: HEAT repeat domain-containing protein [Planctomycetota bacterium]